MGKKARTDKEHASQVSRTVARAIKLIEAHPSLEKVSETVDSDTSNIVVEVNVRLSLPNSWMADRVSPNGVRSVEPVHITFSKNYPLEPPVFHLRMDFDRSVAHIQSGDPTLPAVPCLFDGSLGEVLQRDGFAVLLNQLVVWLERAARGRLIDRDQGWEPVQRDNLPNIIVAPSDQLERMVNRDGGHSFFMFAYCRVEGVAVPFFRGILGSQRIAINSKNIDSLIGAAPAFGGGLVVSGRALCLFVWPGKHPDGTPVINDQYLPETVVDLESLYLRADSYGCGSALREGLKWLETCLFGKKSATPFPLAIILCARRPYRVIRQTSELELCSYIVECSAPKLFPDGGRTVVVPSAHREAISIVLLRRMTGESLETLPVSWAQLGCGSLGSKIAIHATRAGRGPFVVIDSGLLNPHNAARHALLPTRSDAVLPWVMPKARALAEAIREFGQSAKDVFESFEKLAISPNLLAEAIPKSTWCVVNSTASLTVRESLGALPTTTPFPRVIETSLFAVGRVGMVSVEGPDRNPNTLDLVAEAYCLIQEDQQLCGLVFGEESGAARVPVGEGCGSFTMAMSDARVSMQAAPMSESLLKMQRDGLPGGGMLLLSRLKDDEISLAWSRYEIPPVHVVSVDRAPDWTVRISGRALRKIEHDVTKWSTVETGGIIMGRISEAAKVFYISDVLPPPDDSTRSATLFTLGTRGARRKISDYSKSSNYSLFCLGTWHSHLRPSGPSATDEQTATTVALARLAPSILIIHTPNGFRAILADSIPQSREAYP